MDGFRVRPASLKAYGDDQVIPNAQHLLDVRNYLNDQGRKTDKMDGALKWIVEPYLKVLERQVALLSDMNTKLAATGRAVVGVGQTYEKEDAKHAASIDTTLPNK